MKPVEYILGYVLAIIPMIALQNVLFFILAVVLGLPFSVHIIWAILVSFSVSVLFIAVGINIGSVFSEKASSGIASIVVQLVCFTSGMYFPREMLGKGFAKVCEFLPFESCVTIIKGVMNNDPASITPRNIIIFAAYTVVVFIIAVVLFQKKMLSDNKGS